MVKANNESMALNDHLVPSRDVQIALYSIVSVVSFVSNTLLFLVLGFTKKLHTKTNFLLVSLGLTDWLIIAFGSTVNISNLSSSTPIASGKACKLTGVLVLIPFLVSNFNMALISFHRYTLIVRNGSHKRIFSTTKLILYVIGVWVFGIILTVPPLCGWGRISYNASRAHCMVDWSYSKSYLFFVQIAGFPIPLFVMAFSYYKVFTHSYISHKRLRASTDRHNLKQKRREISLSLCLLIVLVVFFSLYTPYAVLIYMEGIFQVKASPAFGFAALFLAYSNSMCDFWIYAGMSKKFRTACFNLFRVMFLRFKRNSNKVFPQIKDSIGVATNCNVNIDDGRLRINTTLTPIVSVRRRSVMDPDQTFYKNVDIELRSNNNKDKSSGHSEQIKSFKKDTYERFSSSKDTKPALFVTISE